MNVPATRYVLTRGVEPKGVTLPFGEIRVTVIPGARPRRSASREPRITECTLAKIRQHLGRHREDTAVSRFSIIRFKTTDKRAQRLTFRVDQHLTFDKGCGIGNTGNLPHARDNRVITRMLPATL